MHGTHPIQIVLELLIAALAKVVMTCVLVFVAICFVVMGLLFGGVILALLKKKRHLFWILPLINFLVYLLTFPAVSFWLWRDEMTFSDHFRYPMVDLTIMAFLFFTLLGWISAALLAPAELLLRSLRAVEEKSTADADHFLSDYLERPREASQWAAFREGLSAPWFGLAYLCGHPWLWRYSIIPILLNLLITGFALILFFAAVAGFAVYLHPVFPPGWGWLLLEIFCGVFLVLLTLGATLATWMLLQGILCGHYYEKLARQVELQLGVPPEELQELSLGKQMVDVLLDLAVLMAVSVGLLLLHVIPVAGSIVAILGSLCFYSYVFGAEYLGLPLSLRGRHRKERRAFTRRFLAQTMGLGTVVFFVGLIPLIGAFVLVTAVVGAVLLHRRLQANAAGEGTGPPGKAHPQRPDGRQRDAHERGLDRGPQP